MTINTNASSRTVLTIGGRRSEENSTLFIDYFNKLVWSLESLLSESYGGIDVSCKVQVDNGRVFDIIELREAAAAGICFFRLFVHKPEILWRVVSMKKVCNWNNTKPI